MDDVLHFVFWAIVEVLLFRVGRLALRSISFGRIRLERPSPLQSFTVAGLGLLVLFSLIFLIVAIV